MGYITLEHITAVAKTLVKTSDNIDRNVWKEWICTMGVPFLGIGDDEIDIAEVFPKNLIAPLPENLAALLEISLFDSAGNQLNHKFRTGKQRIFVDRRVSQTTIVANSPDALVPVDVGNDGKNLVLGTNGTNVERILIRFFKRPFDETGRPQIHEEDMLACVALIKWLQAWKEDDNQSKIQEYKYTWQQAADQAIARKKTAMMPPERAKTVLKEMMRLIPSFDQSQF